MKILRKTRRWKDGFERIKAKKGVNSQKELIGKHRSLITKIETGDANLNVNTAKALGQVLKVRWTKFFED